MQRKPFGSRIPVFVTLILLVCCAIAEAQSAPKINSYAEGLYTEFAAGTQGSVSFQVTTLDRGPLTSLQGMPFNGLLSAPPYRLETSDNGTELLNAHFVLPQNPSYNLHDMGNTVDRFSSVGYPVSDGSYRRLNVTGTIGSETRQWEAMEFCWPGLGHCAVLDPVVVFLQSKVDNRLKLASEGWGAKMTPIGEDQGFHTPSGTCGLSSHHNWIGLTITWGAYSVSYKDIFGVTLVHKSLGEQQYGLSCNISCYPAPFSRSDTSSAWGTLGWTTACDNTGDATGKTGRTAKEIAQTKCTHKFVQHASASVTIKGYGASISADWTLGGGVDSNGGSYTDTCGYF
jgi:hypothetical protein